MSRFNDLAGVLKGVRKVVIAFNKQNESRAGEAWVQSSIREGVERAVNNVGSPEALGKAFVRNIPTPILEARTQIEELIDNISDSDPNKKGIAGLEETVSELQRSVKDAAKKIKSVTKHVVRGDIGNAVKTVGASLSEFKVDDIVGKSAIDQLQGFADEQNIEPDIIESEQTENETPIVETALNSVSAIVSLINSYQTEITNLESATQNLNKTIELINEQVNSSTFLPDLPEELDIDADELNSMAATGVYPKIGESQTRQPTGDEEEGQEFPDLNDVNENVQNISNTISQLRSNITSLQDEAALLTGSAKHISDDLGLIMDLIAKGDVGGAADMAQQRLNIGTLPEDIDDAISSAYTGMYPIPGISNDPQEEENVERDPVTLGNYTNPFKPDGIPPSSRGYHTMRYYNPCKQKPTIYQLYLNRLLTADSKRNGPILTVDAESFDTYSEPESHDSLASYASRRGTTTKRKRLDARSQRKAVPDTKMKRALAFGGLAASLGVSTLSEALKRAMNDPASEQNRTKSIILTEQNIELIVAKLCEMRGAALKIGQAFSILDEDIISPEVAQIFARVRENADFMPSHQLESQMRNNLGESWQAKFKDFDYTPFAAASLGQVHYATLLDDTKVVVKVQYPGVANSIHSDIDSITMLLNVTNLAPKGMYAENALKIAKKELTYETDYIREASSQEKMRGFLTGDNDFEVPRVYLDLTTKQVLTQKCMEGEPVDQFMDAPQKLRNSIGLKMLKLCLRELFEFQFMQTDPNWSNFFYDPVSKRIKLLDFGATMPLTKEFSDDYLRVIRSCATNDRETIIDASTKMGFLTGYESEVMLDAHCEAIRVVGEPFEKEEPYDFVEKAAYKRVGKLMEVFAKHRLTPPPEESYALNRKLSGAFMLCSKLNVIIPCKPLFDAVYYHKVNDNVRN